MDGITNSLKLATLATAIALMIAPAASAKDRQKDKNKASCPLPSNGVRCVSLQDVYRRTDNVSELRDEVEPAPVRNAPPSVSPGPPQTLVVSSGQAKAQRLAYRPVEHAQAVVQGDTLAVITPASQVQAPVIVRPAAPAQQNYRPPSPDPIRADARVMRILVTAWEDDTGSLHMPGTIFTEIEPRRWTLGAPAPASTTAGYRTPEGPGEQAAKDSHASAAGATAVSHRPGS